MGSQHLARAREEQTRENEAGSALECTDCISALPQVWEHRHTYGLRTLAQHLLLYVDKSYGNCIGRYAK